MEAVCRLRREPGTGERDFVPFSLFVLLTFTLPGEKSSGMFLPLGEAFAPGAQS